MATGPGHGKMPEHDAQLLLPWNEVAVDLIGPWTIGFDGHKLGFDALTCIDPVTDLVELTHSCAEERRLRTLRSLDVPD
jgi:hypothetical protein